MFPTLIKTQFPDFSSFTVLGATLTLAFLGPFGDAIQFIAEPQESRFTGGRTVGGVPVDDDAPKARKVIQPPRDSSPMPGMRYDPALGYYVPNTPAPAKPAPAPQTTDQDQTAEQESRQRLGFTNPLR